MSKKGKALRTEFSIVDNLCGPQDAIFNVLKGLDLNF